MAKDVRLRFIDFDKYSDLDSVCLHLVLNGTSNQRESFANKLTIESCAHYMPISRIFRLFSNEDAKLSAVIVGMTSIFEGIANDFGVKLVGDASKLVWKIHDNYGFMSLADLMKFAAMASNCQFKGDVQHISVRGVTAEFLTDWLNQYDLIRTDTFRAFRNSISGCETEVEYRQKSDPKKIDSIHMENINRRQIMELQKHKIKASSDKLQQQINELPPYFYLLDQVQRVFFPLLNNEHGEQLSKKIADSMIDEIMHSIEDLKLKNCFDCDVWGPMPMIIQLIKNQAQKLNNLFNVSSPIQCMHACLYQHCIEMGVKDAEGLCFVLGLDFNGKNTDLVKAITIIGRQAIEHFRELYNSYCISMLKNKSLPLDQNQFIIERIRIYSMEKIGSCDISPVFDSIVNNLDVDLAKPQ